MVLFLLKESRSERVFLILVKLFPAQRIREHASMSHHDITSWPHLGSSLSWGLSPLSLRIQMWGRLAAAACEIGPRPNLQIMNVKIDKKNQTKTIINYY